MQTLPWPELARLLAGSVEAVPGMDVVSVHGALGRTLADNALSMCPLPACDEAVMDGYALGSSPPGAYTLIAEGAPSLAPNEATAVTAGTPLPDGAAVVVLARRARGDGQTLHVPESAHKDNIRRLGEENAPGSILIEAGTRLNRRHLTLLSAAGVSTLKVRQRPRVAVVSVGDQAAAQAAVVSMLVTQPGLILTDAGNTTLASLPAVLQRHAHECDLVTITGSSLGDETGPLARLISESTVHRAALKPAKPVIAGRMGRARVIGLGGTAYAVSAAAHLFLAPILYRLMGMRADSVPVLTARSGFVRQRHAGRGESGRAEALPVYLRRRDGGQLHAEPAGRFGQLSALAALDGFALISEQSGDIREGDVLPVIPWCEPL